MTEKTQIHPLEHHGRQAALLEKHVDHASSIGDTDRAETFAGELQHTRDRLAHATKASAFVDTLGLGDEVNAHSITRADATNYVAKVLHEVANGGHESHFTRAHAHLEHDEHAVFDRGRLKAPFDPAADVIEHLGLEDPAHVAAAKALFAKVN